MASPLIMSLEPRMLFDGAVAATVADAAQPESHPTADPTADAAKAPASADHPATGSNANATTGTSDSHDQVDAPLAATPNAVPGQTVVFVDSRVKDAADLLKDVAPGTQVVQLDATRDGLQQIADYLDQHQGVSSVQIIAHGNAGDLWLGNSYLSADNVAERSAVLAEIGKDMNVGGDILIYACNTAQGERGISFVDSLAALTGRDIAASTNRTGIGGDWTLEIATGSIESVNALSSQAMAGYDWGLATITVQNLNDSGGGSLRDALASAQNGDIVTFKDTLSGSSVALNTRLEVTKNITLDGDLDNNGTADITLDGQYKTSVIKVDAGTKVVFDGLVITRGLSAGNGGNGGFAAADALGAGISNFGDLTLKNVSVTANAASGGGGGGGVLAPTVGGAGGGGGAVGGGTGGNGGIAGDGTGTYAGTSGTANHGGHGGSYGATMNMGGQGGSTTGGAGTTNTYGYSNGSAGGTASAGGLSIGGGGGGSGWDFTGGKGGSAAGGIYNASSGKLTIVGTSVITGNIGAGGGGGGGSMVGSGTELNGGEAGRGVGAIWNKGSVLITVANFAALNAANNAGGSGVGGLTTVSTASQGVSPTAIPGLFNDTGATSNTAYDPSPTATIVVTTPAQHIGTTSQVTITFSEAVSGFTLADLTAPHGVLSNLATSDGGKTWTATFTPDAGVIGTGHITLDNTGVTSVSLNLAGVGNTLSGNYSVDTVRPTATVTFTGPTLSTTATGTVNITFSEAVSNFSLADMTATNGVLSNLSTSDNIHWTATLTPVAGNASSGNIVTLNNTLYTDTAGNAGIGDSTSGSYVVDTVLPTATIVVANPSLSINDTSVVTITFSEAVTGLTTDDLAVANGTLSALTTLNGGLTWTGTLTATAGIKNTGNVITLNNSGVSDLAGNAGSGSTTSGQYSIDTQRPTASIVFGNNNLGIGQTTTVTITFNEVVSDLDLGDLAVSNGSLSNLATSDGGLTWTATFTPTPGIFSATNHITLDNSGVHDAVGNAGAGTTDSNNVRIDGVRPTATVEVASSSIKAGETSLVTVTFSEAVTNFSNSDLTIANGTLSTLSSSDGGITWTATLTPSSAVEDASNLITLNNTTYQDLSGNAGVGTTDSNNYAIDTLVPTASIVVADPQLTAGETTTVTITFSEAVTGLTLTDLSVANGSLSNLATSDGGTTWTATLTPDSNTASLSNVVSLANGAVADLAGNAGAAANSVNFTIDTVRPNATIVISDPALKIGETSLVTITFNQAVTGFSNADLTISNGTLSAVTSGDGGITWTATFTPSGNTTDASNQIILDNSGLQATVSGNVGVGSSVSNNYAVDTQRPTATVVVDTDHLGVGGSSVVTITFSEAVSGLDLGDLTTDNGILSGLSTSDNITYTATLTPVGGINQANNHIVLDSSGVTDGAGNTGGGNVSSNAYVIDSLRPTATIVMSDSALLAGQTSLVIITFSEPVIGFDNSDLTVVNGTLSTVSSSDGGITWTGTFTPTSGVSDISNLIILNNAGVEDLAGNAGIGVTTSANYSIQTVQPTASIVVANPALLAGGDSLVTITFSEAVSGFDNSDLSVANGTLSNVTSSDGGVTWTATFTPSSNVTDTTNLITLNNTGVLNAVGNTGSGSTDSNNYSIDTQRPTATISVANAHLGIGQTTTVTITFSEAVNGFDLSDLDVTNGVLSNLASADGGTTWTATLTPTVGVTDATNLVILDTSQVTDLAGNQGSGISISNNYGVDADLPSATIVVANPSLTAGQTTTVTITFSEAVTGFDLSDLSVANGTLSNLATSDGGKTWTATLTPTANLTDPSNFITLDNSSYTDLAGNAGTGFANSNNYSVTTVSLAGDPEFRVSEPVAPPALPNVPLQPIIFGPPSGDLGSPLVMPPLFEQRTSGGGLPPISSIFINNGALAPSFIAQVFSTDSGGDGNGSGFLGFGGGDGGVFGSSTLSSLFNQDSGTQSDSLNAFGKHSISSDATQGLRGVFGAPTLGQQLQQLKDNEQRQIQDLTYAFEQAGISEMQA